MSVMIFWFVKAMFFRPDAMAIQDAFAKDGDSGEGGENGGDDGSDDSGESGESGNSGKGSGNSGKGKSENSGFGNIPDRFGRVVEKKSSGSKIELRYSDGWREEIEEGRYSLKNPDGRRVVSRKARNSDWTRMRSLGGI